MSDEHAAEILGATRLDARPRARAREHAAPPLARRFWGGAGACAVLAARAQRSLVSRSSAEVDEAEACAPEKLASGHFGYFSGHFRAQDLGMPWKSGELASGETFYGYCRGDPVGGSDPTGLETEADQRVGSMTDPQLSQYLKGMSAEDRLSFLGQTTGNYGQRTLATIRAGKLELSAGTAPETTVIGESPETGDDRSERKPTPEQIAKLRAGLARANAPREEDDLLPEEVTPESLHAWFDIGGPYSPDEARKFDWLDLRDAMKEATGKTDPSDVEIAEWRDKSTQRTYIAGGDNYIGALGGEIIVLLATGRPYRQAQGLVGADFERWLQNRLGATGNFSKAGREFDAALGSRWMEAKSGRYWSDQARPGPGFGKFKSDMGSKLRIAADNEATLELHSNTPIPRHAREWLLAKGIRFFEY